MFFKSNQKTETLDEQVQRELEETDREILSVEADIEQNKLKLMQSQCRLIMLQERHQRLTTSVQSKAVDFD